MAKVTRLVQREFEQGRLLSSNGHFFLIVSFKSLVVCGTFHFPPARARMETDAEDSCKIKRQKLLPAHQSTRRLPFAQQTSCTVPHQYYFFPP